MPLADETRHAKACFALASAYGAQPLGPGRLQVEGSLSELDLAEIVLTTIREGCIGETVAAVEAREAYEHATDPVVREVLARISEEEARHAELAWRFVNWAVTQHAELSAIVDAEFEQQLSASASTSTGVKLSDMDQELLSSGVIPKPMHATIRQQALQNVIAPCFKALIQRRDAPLAA